MPPSRGGNRPTKTNKLTPIALRRQYQSIHFINTLDSNPFLNTPLAPPINNSGNCYFLLNGNSDEEIHVHLVRGLLPFPFTDTFFSVFFVYASSFEPDLFFIPHSKTRQILLQYCAKVIGKIRTLTLFSFSTFSFFFPSPLPLLP